MKPGKIEPYRGHLLHAHSGQPLRVATAKEAAAAKREGVIVVDGNPCRVGCPPKAATVGDILVAAFRRARALPWKPLAADASVADQLEREAWAAQLSEIFDFDEEARYHQRPPLIFLAAGDAERASYPDNFAFHYNHTRIPELILAAAQSGVKVDPTLLRHATQTLERWLEKNGRGDEKPKPEAWAVRVVAELLRRAKLRPTRKKPT